MDIAGRMVLFAHVVDRGSFSAAARSLALSPSAVSKQIGRLEDHLGVRLLSRSTRRIALTEEGRIFYERCARIATDISEAEGLVSSMTENVRGTLRIAATVAFGRAHLLPLFPQLLKQYPDLQVELELTDRIVDLIQEEVDVAICFSEQISDTSVVARRLAINRRVICTSPAYLEAYGAPEVPEDLLRHNCLRLSTVPNWNDWVFETPERRLVLQVKGSFAANSADAVYNAALSGLGIARLSTYLVGEDLRAGRLVRLLPDYTDEKADILAVYPSRQNLSPKVRAFVDFLIERLKPVPPWERTEADPSSARVARQRPGRPTAKAVA